jgi:hypothetical protein
VINPNIANPFANLFGKTEQEFATLSGLKWPKLATK